MSDHLSDHLQGCLNDDPVLAIEALCREPLGLLALSLMLTVVEQRRFIITHLRPPNRVLHHFFDHCVHIYMYVVIHMHICLKNLHLCTKLAHSSSLSCVSLHSQHCQKLIWVKPTCNLESNASCCNESPITAVLWVLLTDTEAAQTVVAAESEKQRALPAALTSLT